MLWAYRDGMTQAAAPAAVPASFWTRGRKVAALVLACLGLGVVLAATGIVEPFVASDPRQVGVTIGDLSLEVYGPEGPTLWVCVYPDVPDHWWEVDC